MKKIYIPILASAALAPTIAATSCGGGIYVVLDINYWDTNHLVNEQYDHMSCNNGMGYEFVVDYTKWGDKVNLPEGKFLLVHMDPELESNNLSEVYAFGDDTTITVNDETIEGWDFVSGNAEIDIADPTQLYGQIVKIRTTMTNKLDDTEKYFNFEAW